MRYIIPIQTNYNILFPAENDDKEHVNNIDIPIKCYFIFSRYCLPVLLQQYIFIIYTDTLLLYFYILALLCNLIIHNR